MKGSVRKKKRETNLISFLSPKKINSYVINKVFFYFYGKKIKNLEKKKLITFLKDEKIFKKKKKKENLLPGQKKNFLKPLFYNEKICFFSFFKLAKKKKNENKIRIPLATFRNFFFENRWSFFFLDFQFIKTKIANMD